MDSECHSSSGLVSAYQCLVQVPRGVTSFNLHIDKRTGLAYVYSVPLCVVPPDSDGLSDLL